MFTGIIEATGVVRAMEPPRSPTDGRLYLEEALPDDDLRTGDSVAVSGCCLTVVDRGPSWLGFDVSAETLARTTLGGLAPGDRVNLERPVRLSDRLGGHLVQGHVDGVGVIRAPAPELAVELSPELARYVVEKGSIAVDGCSLTVVEVSTDTFRVAVIPHTAAVTTLGSVASGDRVNLEVDVIAKYVARLVEPVATAATDRGAHGEP
ncbi:MAG: riboflavin synthase [Acidimicrobiales bacterium]|nr:riboflavin synthase [Acidimicrobiales bacterium]